MKKKSVEKRRKNRQIFRMNSMLNVCVVEIDFFPLFFAISKYLIQPD